jgi:hypothetical protein
MVQLRKKMSAMTLIGGFPATSQEEFGCCTPKRIAHWRFVGIDEPQMMDAFFREKGRLQKPTPLFHNMGVSSFDCKSNGKQHNPR